MIETQEQAVAYAKALLAFVESIESGGIPDPVAVDEPSSEELAELEELAIIGQLEPSEIALLKKLYNNRELIEKIRGRKKKDKPNEHAPLSPQLFAEAMDYIARYPDIEEHTRNYKREDAAVFARNHFLKFGPTEPHRTWGITSGPNHPDITTLPRGILWKPDSTRGVPALLTPSKWGQVDVVLRRPDGKVIPFKLDKRGKTNPDRETYFFHGTNAKTLPKGLIVEIGHHATVVVQDPVQRYE